jgi:hypothetical protein
LRATAGVRTIDGVKRTLSLVLLAALLLAPCAHAEVIVYFGKVQRLATGDDPPVQKRKAFVVVDQFQKKVAIVTYGRDVIGKRHDFATVEDVDYFTFPRTDGKEEDGFAIATVQGSFSGPSGGGYSGLFLHGARVPLVVSVSGDVKNLQPRAKLLTGTNAGAATTFLGAFYRADSFNVAYNQKRTIEANGAGSTAAAAIAHLVGVIEAMGYVSK